MTRHYIRTRGSKSEIKKIKEYFVNRSVQNLGAKFQFDAEGCMVLEKRVRVT